MSAADVGASDGSLHDFSPGTADDSGPGTADDSGPGTAVCGDGVLAAGEQCDDGNTTPGDGCDASCQFKPVGACGDNTMDPGEVCDDGNTTGGDGCDPTCNFAGTTELFAGTVYATEPVRMDGTGTAARFAARAALAADTNYLWVAEEAPPGPTPFGSVLRRIEIATGIVETVATIQNSSGVASNGDDRVWVAGSSGIEVITTTGSPPFAVRTIHTIGTPCDEAGCYVDGPPGIATFATLSGLIWYGGYLWIVDSGAAVIRRMNAASGEVITVAGSPFVTSTMPVDGVGAAARFRFPIGLGSDGSGTLYISDEAGASIRALDVSSSLVTTFAGNGTMDYVDGLGGPSGPARLRSPRGITSDGTNIYFVDPTRNTVRQGVIATLNVSTLAGVPMTAGGYAEGTGSAARFDEPWSIVYHDPTRALFVMDAGNHVIRRIQ